MLLSLNLYENELNNYLKEKNINNKNIEEAKHEAINNVDFHHHVLDICSKKLKKTQNDLEKNNYIFLAKLVTNGIVENANSKILDASEENKVEYTNYCKKILETKKEIIDKYENYKKIK